MEHLKVPDHKEVMLQIRSQLKSKRGYAPRIADKLKVTTDQVYNVAHGRAKNAKILKALVIEATTEVKDPFKEIITEYLNQAA